MPNTSNPFYFEVAKGVEHVAFENGYMVLLCHSGYDPERESRCVDVLRGERVAGALWVSATPDFEAERRFVDNDVPVVFLDRQMPGDNVLCAFADNLRGGYLATEHLIHLGHRRVGYIARQVDLRRSHERLRGFAPALADHGLEVDESIVARGGFRLEDGRKALIELLEVDSPPTAVVAHNDIMALGALRAAFERGLRVPKDFSILGFDDIPQTAFTCPALTTVSQPKFEMGQRAAQLLLDLIVEGRRPPETPTALEVGLIVRASTGPAPQPSA